MTLALFAVVLGLASSAAPPKPNYDFQPPLYTVVDRATKAYFTGWSGDCNSGRLPLSLQLWRTNLTTLETERVDATLETGPRPDAAAWLAATCGRPFDPNLGWSLVPKNPEPPGEYQYAVFVTDVPTSWACKLMPPGYPNSGQMICDYMANIVYRIIQ